MLTQINTTMQIGASQLGQACIYSKTLGFSGMVFFDEVLA